MDLLLNKLLIPSNIFVVLTSLFYSSTLTHGHEINQNQRNVRGEGRPMPCCFPYRFRAVIVNLPSFSPQKKEVTRLYRDWDSRIQIQENVVVNLDGVERSIMKIIMDFQNKQRYVVTEDGHCQSGPITYGMLEPCMPDDSTYLGKSYIGLYDETTHFDAWNFPRTDKNRNIDMTVVVTSDRCVPVTEHIMGTLGGNPMDALVLFTNVTEDVSDSSFNIPLNCLDDWSMM